jgi:hypothetical protein
LEEIQNILSNLFRDQRVNNCILKFVQPCEADDLKQDVFETLLNKDHGLILDLHNQGNLFFYTIIVIKNLSRSNNRSRVLLLPVDDIPEDIPDYDNNTEKYLMRFNNLDKQTGTFYYKEIIKAVAKYGSMRKAAKTIGIPVPSFRRDVLIARELITKP